MTFISKSPEGLMFCGNFWLPYGSQSSEKNNIAISGIMDRDNASSLAGRLKKALRIL
jgi:hypothetical protein